MRVEGSGFRIQGSGFRVERSRLGVHGEGLRLQGLGFGVIWDCGYIYIYISHHVWTSRGKRKWLALCDFRGSGVDQLGADILRLKAPLLQLLPEACQPGLRFGVQLPAKM